MEPLCSMLTALILPRCTLFLAHAPSPKLTCVCLQQTALHRAAQCRCISICKTLIDHGCDFNAQDVSGTSPILIFARDGNAQQLAAFVNMCKLRIMWLVIVSWSKTSMARMFRTWSRLCVPRIKRLQIDARDHTASTPLMQAASFGHGDATTALIQLGANGLLTDLSHRTVLHRVKDGVCCNLIASKFPKVLDHVDIDFLSPLHLAAADGNAAGACLHVCVCVNVSVYTCACVCMCAHTHMFVCYRSPPPLHSCQSSATHGSRPHWNRRLRGCGCRG